VDSQTRHALKQDKFVQATQGSVSWIGEHSATVIRWSVIAVVVLAVVIGGGVYYNSQSTAASSALGVALDTYSSPLAQPGVPAGSGTFQTAADRSKAANQEFVAVTTKYSWAPASGKAHYFAGLTYQELGQTASAETELKTASNSWDGNVASLAKFALAGFYHQTGRDAQAIEIYTALGAKGTGRFVRRHGQGGPGQAAVGEDQGCGQGRRCRSDCRAEADRQELVFRRSPYKVVRFGGPFCFCGELSAALVSAKGGGCVL